MNLQSTSQPGTASTESGAWFQATQWSMVMAAGGTTSTKSREAMESLCNTYYKPLYGFVRAKNYSVEDAEDLLQEFFTRVLASDYFQRVDPKRGRLRTFLLTSLKHFLTNEWKKNQTIKRGGQFAFVSLEELEAEDHFGQEPSHELTPEKLYDKKWGLALIETATESLRREFMAAGEEAAFATLQGFLTGGTSSASYQEAAAVLGLSEDAVRMRVHRLRRRFGDLMRTKIANTVADESEIRDEMRYLFAAWS